MANITQWACEQAARERSPATCDACTFWQPPALVAPTDEQRARLHATTRTRPTTAWFMCVNRPQNTQLKARHSKFIQLVQVAVASAKLNAPSLAPYILYMHSDGQNYDEPDYLSSWLKALGVRVINTRLSFADEIPRVRWRMKTLTGARHVQQLQHDAAQRVCQR